MPTPPDFDSINAQITREYTEHARVIEKQARDQANKAAREVLDGAASSVGGTTKDIETVASAASTFKDAFDREKSDEEKEADKETVTSSGKGLLLARALQPSHKSLDPVEIERAHLAKAGKIASRSGMDSAQDYLNQAPGMSDYKIDKDLSTPEGLVVEGPQGVEVSFRGTNKTNLSDLATNLAVATGAGESSEQYKAAQDLFDAAKTKYGKVDHVSGFSMGGGKALKVSAFNDVPGTAFNPHIPLGPSVSLYDPKVPVKILRTTSDMVSLGLATSRLGSKVEVKSFNPVSDSPIPHVSHLLENFTDRHNQRAEDNHLARLVKQTTDAAVEHGQYDMLKDHMAGVDAGKSFTDHIRDYNGGRSGDRDTIQLEDGSHVLSGKILPEHPYVRSWLDAGGEFDKGEIDSILQQKPAVPEDRGAKVLAEDHEDFLNGVAEIHDKPNDMGLSPEQREEFIASDESGQNQIIEDSKQKAILHADELTDYSHPILSAADPDFLSTLKSSVHPTGLLAGLGSGFLAQRSMRILDPDKSFGEFTDTGIEGALAGGFTALTSAGLGVGSLGLLPEIGVGAGSYLLQSYSAKGISAVEEKLGVTAGSDFETATSDIGSSALTGAAVGSLAGGPVGAAVGAGLGAVVGGLGYLWGKYG